MIYDPNPLLVSEVRLYFQRLHSQLETVHNATGQGPGTWESYLTTRGTGSSTSPDLNHVARYGSLYLSASAWAWPGMLTTFPALLEARWRAAADYLCRVQQPDGRWERTEGAKSSLDDAFATSDAVDFLGKAVRQDDAFPLWAEAVVRGQDWLSQGLLEETASSNGHTGPPLDAAIAIQNPNFVASILRALAAYDGGRKEKEIRKGIWYLLQAQDERGTWWWYGTDDRGRTTFSMTYHELVVAGLAEAWDSGTLGYPLTYLVGEVLKSALAFMVGQQAPSGPVLPGSLRQYRDEPGISPMGGMGLSLANWVLLGERAALNYTVLRALMANYHPTDPRNPLLSSTQAWAQGRGAIARSLAAWMEGYR